MTQTPLDLHHDDIEEWSERAGIMQYDGLKTRAMAELDALECIKRQREQRSQRREKDRTNTGG